MNFRTVILLVFSLLLTPFAAEKVTIYGDGNNSPKIYLNNGEPKGILVDILRYVESRSDYEFNIELYPWSRAYHLAKSGEGGIIGFSMNDERLKKFDYSDIVYYDDIVLITRADCGYEFEKLEDLKGKVIGIQQGASYGPEFEKGKKNVFKVIEDYSPESRFKRLLMKRIDAIIIGPGAHSFYDVLDKYPDLKSQEADFKIHRIPFQRDPNYVAFTKTSDMKTFLIEFNRIIQTGYENGDIERIITSYKK